MRKATASGVVGYDGLMIGVGRCWAGAHVRVVAIDQLVHIYHGSELVRVLLPDRNRIHSSGFLPTKVLKPRTVARQFQWAPEPELRLA